MRAQNEPPETTVRLVRGEIDGEPTDVPGVFRVERVDAPRSQRAASGRRAAARRSPGSRSAPAKESARSTSARRRVARRRSWRGEVVAVEKHPGRARELEENVARLGADERPRRLCRCARRCQPSSTGFDRALVDAPCSGLGVLNQRPDLRWRAEPLPGAPARAPARGRRASQARRHDRLLRVHDERRRERSDRRRLWPRRRRPGRRVAGLSATPSGPSSCSRYRTSTAPAGFFIARLKT